MSTSKAGAVAIIGAGPTGLTAAWRLQSKGCEVRVFERADEPGGRAMSVRKDGFVFDVGAITMLPTYKNTCALIEELGIGGHLHRVAPVIGIPRDGRIHTLDLARPLHSLLTTRLLSTRAKLRLWKLLPPLLRTWRRANYTSLAPLADWDGESIADYVRRELGDEIHEYIAGPVIRGNTLNSTESAPIGELWWMLRQYAAPFVQNFDCGINFLSETLAQRLPVQYGSEVMAVRQDASGVRVRGTHRGTPFDERFDACVVAVAPDALRSMDVEMSPQQRQFLESIRPLPSLNIHVGLRRRPDVAQTFILPPESEQPVLTTIVMDHLKAPGRAPPGKGLVSLLCRDSWCAENFDRPDDELLASVLEMAAPYIGDVGADVESYVIRRWPYAIIKSEPGLYRRIAAYEQAVDPRSRVQIGGDFLSMGMESAVSSGERIAGRIAGLLHATPGGAEEAGSAGRMRRAA